MHLTLDLTRLSPELRQSVVKSIHHEDRARYALGVLDQLRLKRLYDQAAEPGWNTDLGRTSMIVSAGQYQEAINQYGEKCWADPDFAPWLRKRDPVFRVRDVPTKVQSGWTPKSL